MRNMFKTVRGNAGIGERIQELARDGVTGNDWEPVADWALARYDTRIRAVLRKKGLDIQDDGPLTVESLKLTIERRSGLEIAELTTEGVAAAFDKRLAAELSRVLGLEITGVFDQVALKEQIKQQVVQKLANGSGGALIKGDTLEALKVAATFARAGLSGVEKQRAMNRYRQKKYRRNHRLTWN